MIKFLHFQNLSLAAGLGTRHGRGQEGQSSHVERAGPREGGSGLPSVLGMQGGGEDRPGVGKLWVLL